MISGVQRMRALVIGTGAVAAFLGAALEERGFLPAFYGRKGPANFTARLTYPHGAERLLCCRTPSAGAERPAMAFVAVKAFDLEQALKWVSDLPAGTPIIPVANGDIEDIVRQAAAASPHLTWRLGYSTFGVSALNAPGHFAVRAKSGEVAMGALHGEGEPTAAEKMLLDKPGVFVWHSDMMRAVHRKWLFNVVINTLCAARGLRRNGDLMADIPMLSAVFHEAWALGEERFGAWGFAKAETFQALEALIAATADNENSMARDKRLGRKTETAFLAGLAQDRKAYPLLMELAAQAG